MCWGPTRGLSVSVLDPTRRSSVCARVTLGVYQSLCCAPSRGLSVDVLGHTGVYQCYFITVLVGAHLGIISLLDFVQPGITYCYLGTSWIFVSFLESLCKVYLVSERGEAQSRERV